MGERHPHVAKAREIAKVPQSVAERHRRRDPLLARGGEAVQEIDEALVGEGDAVGVASEVLEHLLGAGEGGLGVDNPVVLPEGGEPRGEGAGLRGGVGEGELAEDAARSRASRCLARKTIASARTGKRKISARSTPPRRPGVGAPESAGAGRTPYAVEGWGRSWGERVPSMRRWLRWKSRMVVEIWQWPRRRWTVCRSVPASSR